MATLRLPIIAHRVLQKPMVPLHFRQVFLRKLTVTTKKFRERRDPHYKWELEWKRRGGKEFTNDILLLTEYEYPHRLNPIYHRHLGTSILDALKNFAKDPTPKLTVSNICMNSIYDHPLVTDTSGQYDPMADGYDFSDYMDSYIQEFGVDLTRLYVIIKGERQYGNLRDEKAIRESFLQLERLLATAWAAIVIVHDSYVDSQPSRSSETSASLDEPESFIDDIVDEVPSYVHSPPNEWNADSIHDTNDARLCLAMQNAIRSSTLPLGVQNTPEAVEQALRALAQSIIDSRDCVRVADHFQSARALLCLIAPLAPSFAEEAWRVLLEGPSVTDYTPNGADAILLEIEREEEEDKEPCPWIRPEDVIFEVMSLPDLPIKGAPETLCSVFDQAFPRRISSLELNKLKKRQKEMGKRKGKRTVGEKT